MATKLTRLTHKRAKKTAPSWQKAVPFAVLAPGGQSVNFWIHPRTLCGFWFITLLNRSSSVKSFDIPENHNKFAMLQLN